MAQLSTLRFKMEERLAQARESIAAFKVEIVEASETQTNFLQDGTDHAAEQTALAARIELHERNMIVQDQLLLALERIYKGVFGKCMHCDDVIDPRRLEALPTTTSCVRCKRLEESLSPTVPFTTVAWVTPQRLTNLNFDRWAA